MANPFIVRRNRNLKQAEYDELFGSLPDGLRSEPEFNEYLDRVVDYVAMNSRWANVDVARAMLRLIAFICSSSPVVKG